METTRYSKKIDLEAKREINRLKRERNEQDREKRSMKIIDPRLVNQNFLLSNNEESIKILLVHQIISSENSP
jgi:hypothetical protein